MDNYDKIADLTNLVCSCLMPELRVDIGSELISTEHFEEFRKDLDQNLINIFDMVQVNEHFLTEDDSNFIEFQVRFILLLCEQTSTYSSEWHQTKKQYLLENARKLFTKHFEKILSLNEKINKEIFDYYKNKLVEPVWKRNIGSIVGFIQFLNTKYNTYYGKMKKSEVTFALSVGFLLQDFFDPVFKEMGLEIFGIILKRTDKADLIELNIHNVIYEELRKDINKYDSLKSVEYLWEILIQSLSIKEFKYSYAKFTDADYLLKDLFYQITTAKSFEIWLALMRTLIHIFFEASSKNSKVKKFLLNKEKCISEDVLEIRKICVQIEPNIAYRWAKTILECLVAESSYLIGISNKTIQALNTFHLCYLICILPINLNVCNNLLHIFFPKISAVLMEVLRLNKSNNLICDGVKEFLKTFIYHIEKEETLCDLKLKEYITIFKDLVDHVDIFKI